MAVTCRHRGARAVASLALLLACGERPAPPPEAGAGSLAPAAAAPEPSWTVGLRSTGPVRYGMT
ncbi:MAG: hypothetical protein ACREMH_00220, partial [Gemmatimonadales bacterium]